MCILTNSRLEEWVNKYGILTSFNYIVEEGNTREPMGLRDNSIINHGLTLEIMEVLGDSEHGRYIQHIDEIDSNLLSVSKIEKGLMVSWIFPGTAIKTFEEEIIEVIEQGFNWVDLKYEFMGTWGKTNVQ